MGKMKDLAIQQLNVDSANSRRGRNARQRGHSWERTIAADLVAAGLDGKRIGQAGGKTDVSVTGEWIVQAKKGRGAISQRQWDWLMALTPRAGERRALALSDAPGAGVKSRRLVVIEYETWLDLIGVDR